VKRRILFDVNVVLDVLLDRKPHAGASAVAFAAVETGVVEGFLAAHAVTTIHYLIRRELSPTETRRVISGILRVFGVAPVDAGVMHEALQLSCPDFEDAVTAAAGRFAGCEYIVTRDTKGFRGSPIRPVTPEALAPILNSK